MTNSQYPFVVIDNETFSYPYPENFNGLSNQFHHVSVVDWGVTNAINSNLANSTNDLAQSIQQSYVSRKEFDDLKHLQKSDANATFVFLLLFCVMFIIVGHALDNRVKKK